MALKALLLDGFGTVLDWRASYDEVHDDALKRAYGSVDGLARLPPYVDWRARYQELRVEERKAKEASLEERDYRARFANSFEGVGLGKRQARALTDKALERFFRELGASVRVAPDAGPEFWRTLPDGLKVALVTNFGHGESLRAALDRLGLFFRFDAVVVTGDVGYLKPHPLVFERALGELGVEPEEALMVGDDHERDVLGAVRAGMRAALVANPREGLKDVARAPQPVDPSPGVARVGSLAELATFLDTS